jgi:hypothetical protein
MSTLKSMSFSVNIECNFNVDIKNVNLTTPPSKVWLDIFEPKSNFLLAFFEGNKLFFDRLFCFHEFSVHPSAKSQKWNRYHFFVYAKVRESLTKILLMERIVLLFSSFLLYSFCVVGTRIVEKVDNCTKEFGNELFRMFCLPNATVFGEGPINDTTGMVR